MLDLDYISYICCSWPKSLRVLSSRSMLQCTHGENCCSSHNSLLIISIYMILHKWPVIWYICICIWFCLEVFFLVLTCYKLFLLYHAWLQPCHLNYFMININFHAGDLSVNLLVVILLTSRLHDTVYLLCNHDWTLKEIHKIHTDVHIKQQMAKYMNCLFWFKVKFSTCTSSHKIVKFSNSWPMGAL